uniref:Glycosyltransferase-like protein LARGE1 n=1 Tax=Mesocestoides corti TaxID=53468 RepID=A0A5K3EG06_MESCO
MKKCIMGVLRIKLRKISVFQPLVRTQQTTRIPLLRLRNRLHLPMSLFVVAICILLSLFCITIWVHTSLHVAQNSTLGCILGDRFASVKMIRNEYIAQEPTPTVAIDIVIFVGGGAATRKVPLLVKSVFHHRLFKRRCMDPLPLYRFHVICDALACKGISVLFKTWRISGLTQSYFYNASEYMSIVNWIPNMHYSGGFGLLKLAVADILPQTVKRVILLDVDILVEGSLVPMWNSADTFQKNEVIGLVENQSDWYLVEHGTSTWPALGRGYNTGIMLMDLKKMRSVGWDDHWRRVARQLLKKISHTALGDQDIINSALYFNSTRVHRLPCAWNFQLADSANYSTCLQNDRVNRVWSHGGGLRILHWNRPSKTLSSIEAEALFNYGETEPTYHSDTAPTPSEFRMQFAKISDRLSNLDGSLFRDTGDSYMSQKTESEKRHSGALQPCPLLQMEKSLRRRIFPYFFGTKTKRSGKVTLVSQLTLDRLHRLEEISGSWEGPMSLAVYLTDRELTVLTEYLDSSSFLALRSNIYIHLVFQEGSYFPINTLRNTALEYADTEFVFIIDFDFIPNPGLYSYLQAMLTAEYNVVKVAYIIPAFETFNTQLGFPETKEHLLKTISSGTVKPFRIDVWKAGHMATNYSRWYTTDKPYEVLGFQHYSPSHQFRFTLTFQGSPV